MIKNFLRKIKRKILAAEGFHTDKKLVVIESDDWGSIRMPSKEVFLNLQKLGDTPEKDIYLKNDSLETEEDLKMLFDTLDRVYQKTGKKPIISAYFALFNPDFDKTDYKKGEYFNESFLETYKKNENTKNSFSEIKKGIKEGFFFPQLHCREHLNVKRFMKDLKSGNENTVISFENRTMGIYKSMTKENSFGYMDAFNYDNEEEKAFAENTLIESFYEFEKVFGFKSKTFAPSCYIWGKDLEKKAADLGIKTFSTRGYQDAPNGHGTLNLKRKRVFMGKKGGGVRYVVRNCMFEPNKCKTDEILFENAFREVDMAFKDKRPLVICSHRMNYTSNVFKENRTNGLRLLEKFLITLIEKYPDVEFITSEDLANKICK